VPSADELTQYNFGIAPDTLDALRTHARQEDRSVAWVIRRAIDLYLEEWAE
jgi:hypothetical protein